MEKLCIVSDFDGTITDRDGLYYFIKTYAKGDWEKVENDWAEGKISSKECLIKEFLLIPDLSEELVAKFIKTINIDIRFKKFYNYIKDLNIDFYIVSDGVDYFIDKILANYNLKGLNVVSNHGEFQGKLFKWSFPNDSKNCKNNAGTCKCEVLKELRQIYDKIIYIGDGVSDYCVADKADILFAKQRLLQYCKDNNISCVEYKDFSDIQDCLQSILN